MKISYAILVKDEISYIEKLINTLNTLKDEEDEIIVLQDMGENSSDEQKLVKQFLLDATFNSKISYYFSTNFKNDFSEIKNKLNSKCKGDYIFNIDADELPMEILIKNIKTILNNNKIDLLFVPRINTVDGLTQEHINRWGWKVSHTEEFGSIINYPDFQGRIYKNSPEIKWSKPVHETIVGHSTHGYLPYLDTFDFCLLHPKDITRQEKQNELYEEIK